MPVPLFLIVAALAAQASRAPAPDTTSIWIAATADVHGRATAWDYERDREAPLGLVRAATAIAALRRAHPGRVVVVDAGDLLQGNALAWIASLEPGRAVNPMIMALDAIGYDAAVPGNHEYDVPLATLARMQSGRTFPLLSANIVRAKDGVPKYQVETFVTRGGVRIGITGVTTPGVLVWDGPQVRGLLDFRPVADAVPPAVRHLRSGGADVTVLVAHAGLDGAPNYSTDAAPPDNDVAAALRASGDVDVAVIGHIHGEIAESTVAGALVIQPRNFAQSVAVARVDLVRRRGHWRVAAKHGTVLPLGGVAPDSALVGRLADWHRYVRERVAAPIGRSADAMPAARGRLVDAPVSDFVAEVMRRRAGADLAATSVFDTAAGIPAGDVGLRDLVGVYPYENTLRAVRISGADLRAFLERSARYYRGTGPGGPVINDSVPGYNFDVVSGADYELDLAQPVGRRVSQLLVHGHDVGDTDSFTLALNNYRQQGGGGFTMFARAPVTYDRNESIRDLLVEEIRRVGTLRAADYFTRNWRIRGVDDTTRAAPAGTGDPTASPARDSILLRVFAMNDLHGALEPKVQAWSNRRPVGGAAALAGMMDRLAAECACTSIRLDGGDVMQGTPISNLTYGRSSVEVLGAMHVAASAIGNHEFDWGIDTLAARIREARYPWLSANIRVLATRRPPAWDVPSVIVQAGGVRVGVVGYTTPGTTTSTRPENVAALGFPGAEALDSAIVRLRAERPDYVIVVAHEGAFCDRDTGCRGAVVDLANALVHRPDLIVSGHTHSLVTTTVNGIPIVQARSHGTALGVVDFVRTDSGRAVRMRVETVWADRERPDTAVERIVARYADQVRPVAGRQVATLAQDLPHTDGSPLNDMVADALRASAGADVGLVNVTGVRAGLVAGPVTWGDAYEVLPFANFVVTLPVTGAVLRQALEHGLQGEARIAVSGITVAVDRTRPAGQRVAAVTFADGRALRDDATYTLATFDFLAGGGSGYAMLRALPARNTGVDELDAFIAWLQHQPQPVRVASPYAPRITGTP
jgi:2',3'-cyclic-nucleotide 2'-phosphodiesterase/3'-nucleotidase/5'-nucleotidase